MLLLFFLFQSFLFSCFFLLIFFSFDGRLSFTLFTLSLLSDFTFFLCPRTQLCPIHRMSLNHRHPLDLYLLFNRGHSCKQYSAEQEQMEQHRETQRREFSVHQLHNFTQRTLCKMAHHCSGGSVTNPTLGNPVCCNSAITDTTAPY